MDPITLGIAMAFGTGISSVLQKVADAAVQPVVERALDRVLGLFADDAQKEAFANAVDAALVQAMRGDKISRERKMQLEAALAHLAKPEFEEARVELAARVLLASSPDETWLVTDQVLDALQLPPAQRASLTRFLYFFRQQLALLPEMKPLLDVAHDQSMENAARIEIVHLARLSSTVTNVRGMPAQRVVIVNPEWNARPYLEALIQKYGEFRLDLFKLQFERAGEQPITLEQVYTDLDVEETISLGGEREGDGARGHLKMPSDQDEGAMSGARARQRTAVEAVSDVERRCVVLLGYPGSGKSTFINHLAFCLAQEQLTQGAENGLARLEGWKLGALFPVRVILRELVKWADETKRSEGDAQTVWDFVQHQTTKLGFPDDFTPLRQHLRAHGGLFLFDGLDEVREADKRREFIKACIDQFVSANPRSRFIVTCRPYAYRNSAWQLAHFYATTLAVFTPEQSERFVRVWYAVMGARDDKGERWIEECTQSLLDAIENNQRIRELADQPLLLTLMAILNGRGKLPDDRADLYAGIVHFLLDDWQRGKEGVSLSDFGLDAEAVERTLSRVAFDAHQAQGRDEKLRQAAVADIRAETLRKAFKPVLGSGDRAEDFVAFMQTRSGLLKAQGEDTYTFPHRSFQEYFAASYALDSEMTPDDLVALLRQDRVWWREVYLLAAGRGRKPKFRTAWELLDALCHKSVRDAKWNEANVRDALLAAQAADEVRLVERAPEVERWSEKLEQLQQWLVAILERPALNASERVEAGNVLAKLGDPRPGVLTPPPPLLKIKGGFSGEGASQLPSPDSALESGEGLGVRHLLFCEIPAGPFIMGSKDDPQAYDWEKPQFTFNIPYTYYITRYPITNAQFDAFADDPEGYRNDKWWTQAGLKWRGARERNQKYGGVFNLPNHPVVYVTWYEAVVFCRWANSRWLMADGRWQIWRNGKVEPFIPSRRSGQALPPSSFILRLPSEAEWEKAARGTDGRIYPWAGDLTPEHANYDETRINATSAVGAFPLGASPYGVLDMSGNVWEWTNSRWGKDYGSPDFKYPYDAKDGREDVESSDLRVWRGGSFFDDSRYVRCAWRLRLPPGYRYFCGGFRVVLSPV
ncbi:MAG: SUMF1/EgtB/PvdO family nonheme iron enzyme [Chloroflexi bacterium]|nr:SUMF1/EgtB/PvdO family nonheme iron enzyme [Chloroflexota bacterium]